MMASMLGVDVREAVIGVALAAGCAAEPPTLPGPGIDVGSSSSAGDGDAPGSTSEGDGGETTGADPGDATGPAGSSSGGDDTGAPTVCTHTCSADTDCTFVLGLDSDDYVCREARCLYAPYLCTEDEDCVGALAGWTMNPCTATTQCPEDFLCVDVGDGTGGCASTQSCAMAGLFSVRAVEVPSGNSVLVCGSAGGNCVDGICEPGCIDDLDCNGRSCDTESGACVCTSDAQCVALAAGADTCTEGRCVQSCTEPDECTSLSFYRGGSITCD